MSPRPLGRPRPLYITCDAGGEEQLAIELSKLRCDGIEPSHRGVQVWGTEETLWRINLFSRLANRVLIPLAEFEASSREELYQGCKRIRWDWWVHTSQTIAVDASSHQSEMQHTHFIAQVVKDGVVDSMRDRFGERPSVDAANPDLPINARISDNMCTISLDASGTRLHRRGYRTEGGLAPLKETLASLLNHLSGWRPHEPMIDLTCGSGTILIEAALRASMKPLGIARLEEEGFAFQRWRSHAPQRFDSWRESLPTPPAFPAHFWGSDLDRKQMGKARQNMERVGFDLPIHWELGSIEEASPRAAEWLLKLELDESLDRGRDRRAMLIMNVPYGHRLDLDAQEEGSARAFFRDLGRQLKTHFSGCEAWLLVGTGSPWREIGLKPSAQIELRNGSIPVKFVQFLIR